MAKKQDQSPSCESQSCSAKFVYHVSFVSLLICIATLVRVEIINHRVHIVEERVAEGRQNPNMERVGDSVRIKRAERAKPVGEFDHEYAMEGKDATKGNFKNVSHHRNRFMLRIGAGGIGYFPVKLSYEQWPTPPVRFRPVLV